jgi:hypothetical protein
VLGHHLAAGFRVCLDGTYGRAPARQRYRCIDPAGSFHRFTPELPREQTPGGLCVHCDSTVAAHLGPVVSRAYRHRLHLIAEALVAVGRGVSYARAAERARAAAGRQPLPGSSGQMVAEWVDAWAPVLLDAFAETEQPETLVLDSTDFFWTNSQTRTRRREFAVLVAYGYTRRGRGRLWGTYASPTAQASDYLELLRRLRLPGPPASVVADDDRAIATAVRQLWPSVSGIEVAQPFLLSCEHHLRMGAQKALAVDRADAPQGRWMRRLDTAFRRPEGWDEFRHATSVLGQSAAWVKAHDKQLTHQVSVRHFLPPHYSNAAAESSAADLRNMLEQRSFSLRNANRTNLMLGLVRLHLTNRDDANAYHAVLREAATRNDGHALTAQRANRDTQGPNRARQSSLR